MENGIFTWQRGMLGLGLDTFNRPCSTNLAFRVCSPSVRYNEHSFPGSSLREIIPHFGDLVDNQDVFGERVVGLITLGYFVIRISYGL